MAVWHFIVSIDHTDSQEAPFFQTEVQKKCIYNECNKIKIK